MVVLRPLLLVQLVLSVTIAVGELRRSRSTGQNSVPRVLLVLAAVLPAGVLLSAMLSDDRWTGAGGAATALAFAATTAAAALVTRHSGHAARLLRWLVAGASVGAIIGLLVFASGDELWFTSRFSGRITRLGFRPRLTRPWGHANIAAMAIGSALVIALVGAAVTTRATRGSRSERQALLRSYLLRLVSCTVLAVALVLTYSRGGLLGTLIAVVIGSGLFLVWVDGDGWRRGATTAVSVVLVAVGLTMVLASGWRDRAVSDSALDDFSATVEVPSTLQVGPENQAVSITVGNDSGRTWPAVGPDRIELSARWLVADTSRIAVEQRWPLPHDVEPGDTATLTVGLDPRVIDGDYDILWDLLADQEAYFLQFSGRAVSTSATVIGSTTGTSMETIPLVTPRTNLTRGEIRGIATDAFRSSPLVGVGPMQLSSFAEPGLEADQRFPGGHAHNLLLEALATWGLVGAVPLVAILFGGGWRAMRWAGRGDAVGLAVFLGLVVFGLHSTVESPIDEVSAAIPLAVLVGLGWSRVATEDHHPGPDPAE